VPQGGAISDCRFGSAHFGTCVFLLLVLVLLNGRHVAISAISAFPWKSFVVCAPCGVYLDSQMPAILGLVKRTGVWYSTRRPVKSPFIQLVSVRHVAPPTPGAKLLALTNKIIRNSLAHYQRAPPHTGRPNTIQANPLPLFRRRTRAHSSPPPRSPQQPGPVNLILAPSSTPCSPVVSAPLNHIAAASNSTVSTAPRLQNHLALFQNPALRFL
jgi:hypothetical protein